MNMMTINHVVPRGGQLASIWDICMTAGFVSNMTWHYDIWLSI